VKPDDKVCYCFHVTRAKLEKFVRLHRPRVPSQLSECGGAGTGCGWCVPFLRQIFRKGTGAGAADELEAVTPEEYERRRAEYLRDGKGTPPAGAGPA
jgi:NAD(P)H-nitrite reductase large subunit